MLFSLEGKIALVTGGSRGIGRATAIGFAKMGADVVVVSRKAEDLEKVAAEIKGLGRKAVALPGHMGKLNEVQEVASKALSEFGKIDILVNNAGTSLAAIPTLEVTESFWDTVMTLNLKGMFFLTQAIAKVMKEKGGGKIINVTSMDGIKPEENIGPYAISKAAIIMATKVMALEWAKYNIRVNAIAPGNVRTRLGMARSAVIPDFEAQMVKKTPLGRIAEPDEIVGTMLYLASDASSFTTGETILVDGGILLS